SRQAGQFSGGRSHPVTKMDTPTPPRNVSGEPEGNAKEKVSTEAVDMSQTQSGVNVGAFDSKSWSSIADILKEINDDCSQNLNQSKVNEEDASAQPEVPQKTDEGAERIWTPPGRRLTRSMKLSSAELTRLHTKPRAPRKANAKGCDMKACGDEQVKKLNTYARKNNRKPSAKTKNSKTNDVDEPIPQIVYPKPPYIGVPPQWRTGPLFETDFIDVTPFDKEEWIRKGPNTADAMGLRMLIMKNKNERRYDTYFCCRKEKVCSNKATPLLHSMSGKFIGKSFADGEMGEDSMVDYFSQCVMQDDAVLRPECEGYRIILPTFLNHLIFCETVWPRDNYDEKIPKDYIKHRFSADQILNAKLVFLPVHSGDHWAVFCFNMYHGQIDILDSYAWPADWDKWRWYDGVCGRLRERINSIFKRITKGRSPDMSNWGFTCVATPKQVLLNDCAFFDMLFLERYIGLHRKFKPEIDP
ncbi:hypothetical protein EJB05_25576, partial [Eragrostis curvula]